MAEFIASDMVGKVLEKLGAHVYKEICLAWGLESDLEKFKDTLETINAVLSDAEHAQQQTKNQKLSIWLRKVKDVCYDTDDVLDEFRYEAMWRKMVKQGGIKRKVCSFFSSSNPFSFRFKMGHRIKNIKERLDEIAKEKADFNLTKQFENKHIMRMERETHSYVELSDVIGRDDDREKIVWLLIEPSNYENVLIIAIVGLGGLGKTTLAKLVYNDGRVIGYFQLKMWVCVSEDFDVKRMIREIIESATRTKCGDFNVDQLQIQLRDILRDKIFLLVLDDVWSKDRGKWVDLKSLLMVGANGSKIIVTTRMQSIASIMSTGPEHAHTLEGLSHEYCMSLFVNWAFRKGEERQHPNLMKIGKEIVKKCGGVPLAVRTLGYLLYSKTGERDWLSVRDNAIWKLEQKENDILPALRLSYEAMPTYLRQCFAFCSIFPKDFEFNSLMLIRMWFAQGFLQISEENLELEDIGWLYINELRSRSFFQDFEEFGTFFSSFKMHDLVHDLALLVAKEECSIVSFGTLNSISNRLRHVSFADDNASKEAVSRLLPHPYKVRTIRWKVHSNNESLIETCISRFKQLRVLDLSESNIEVLPNSIGKLKHLRYLDLSWNERIKKLPNSICKLVNLQTLKFWGCEEVELPRDIGKLIRLRCLMLTTKQMVLPEKAIRCLTSLRFLGVEGCRNLKSLSEGMQSLTALRTLLIQRCESLEDSLPSRMKYLTALETLALSDCEKLNLEMELKEDLRLGLRTLTLSWLPQLVALPRWLQGASDTLQMIHIGFCQNLMELPESLQNLSMLKKLEIQDCPQLSALPEGMHRLTALTELKIEGCPELRRRCEWGTGEDWPKIAHVPHITLYKEDKFFEAFLEAETDSSVSC